MQQESERRQATIVFADLSGFTSMSEKMDPEDLTTLMNACFGMLSNIIHQYGGTIDKYIGDCIMALFGVPSAIENAPFKAVSAAIEMMDRLREFNLQKRLEPPLELHMGINTGMVVSGFIGWEVKKEYTVMGDAVNTASRFKDASVRGQIFVGETTFKATKNDFEFRQIEPLQMKGKEQPIPVFELLSRKERVPAAGMGAGRMIHSDMVGRDEELNKLQLQLWKLINGEGSVINVIGEAGIGKSRLIAEFEKKIDLTKVHYHKGRALSVGRNLSYHPVIDILKSWADINENETGPVACDKLEKAIHQIAPADVNEIFPFLATLMGYKLSGRHADRIKGIEGEAMEKLILKNFRDMLIRGAALNPLVIMIEDLHWSDISSLELLLSLTRLAEHHRILFIHVLRPQYEETGERLLNELRERYKVLGQMTGQKEADGLLSGSGGNAEGKYIELYLHPLNESQSEQLVHNLLKIKGLPKSLRQQIIERSEGNPYFIEEVIRSFLDEGVIESKKEGFEVTDKIDSVIIPDTINDLLMSRIDRLDEKTRSIVKTASVIGRHFFYRILIQVAQQVEDIDERLHYLETIQMIREGRRKEELEYLFKHALAQEAAYESILLAKRKELHLHVADSIEKLFSERLPEFYGMLAMHYTKAEEMEKAEKYLVRAGEEALKAAASSEALQYYKDALTIYRKKSGEKADPGRIALLEQNIAWAYFNKGQNNEAIDYFDRVMAYYGFPSVNKPFLQNLSILYNLFHFTVSIYFPFFYWRKNATELEAEIIRLLHTRCIALTTFDPKRAFREGILLMKRTSKFDVKSTDLAGIFAMASGMISWAGISFTLAKKMNAFSSSGIERRDIRQITRLKFSEILTFYVSGSWDKIEPYDEELISYGLKIGEFWSVITTLFYYCFLYIEQGHYMLVQDLIRKLNNISDSFDNDYSRSSMYRVKTLFLLKYRKLHETLISAQESLPYAMPAGQKAMYFSISSIRARAFILLGETGKAEETLDPIRPLAPHFNRVPIYIGYYLLTQFMSDLIQLEEALKAGEKEKIILFRKKALEQGLKTVRNSKKIAGDRTEIYKLMGVYYWLTGQQNKALKWWGKSICEGEKLGARLELSRTYFEVGKRLSEDQSKVGQMNGTTAAAYLQKAKELFTEMELDWDLKMLERVSDRQA